MAHSQNFALYNTATGFLSAQILTWQENHTHSQLAAIILMTCAGNMLDEEIARDGNMNTCPITCGAIRINRAAMPDRLQRFDGRFDNITSGFTINRGNKPYTAIIMFPFRRIGTRFNQAGFGFFTCAHKGFGIKRHGISLLFYKICSAGCLVSLSQRRGFRRAIQLE